MQIFWYRKLIQSWYVCALLYFSYIFARHEEYDGHALFSVKTQNVEEAKYFNMLDYPLDVWQYPVQGRDGMVLVPKDYVQSFKNDLSSKGMAFVVEVVNIKESLETEDRLLAEEAHTKAERSGNGPTLTFNDVYNLTEVNNFLEEVVEAYSDVVTLVNVGKSFQGRDMNYLKISTTNFEDTSKPIIFIESLLHAREWVTLPVSLYAIHKLVINITEQDMINNFDWIILPVANPDGYEYSRSVRFWRKNRSTRLDTSCIGVDLNRNFDVLFGLGASGFVCSDTYMGPYAFSEPESKVIRNILKKYEGRIEMFIDLHSFGNLTLYGLGKNELPQNTWSSYVGAIRMAEAIDAVKMHFNTNYTIGNSGLIHYRASGTAMNYGKEAGVPFSYTYELPAMRNHNKSLFGFLVDPDFIEQIGMETWEGIKAVARFARSIRLSRN